MSACIGRIQAPVRFTSIQLDGINTPAKFGGEAVGYLGKKKCSTSNLIKDYVVKAKGALLFFQSKLGSFH
ncbi:MAG TPA: hypothetical protein PKK00_13260 [Bacteroidales bacterium]|nr:hypothetical protein [Bacteroidales bacterium]